MLLVPQSTWAAWSEDGGRPAPSCCHGPSVGLTSWSNWKLEAVGRGTDSLAAFQTWSGMSGAARTGWGGTAASRSSHEETATQDAGLGFESSGLTRLNMEARNIGCAFVVHLVHCAQWDSFSIPGRSPYQRSWDFDVSRNEIGGHGEINISPREDGAAIRAARGADYRALHNTQAEQPINRPTRLTS